MDREKVLVLGAGRSGIAAAKQILGLGGQVVLFDSNEKLNVAELLKNFEKKDYSFLKKCGIIISDNQKQVTCNKKYIFVTVTVV